MINHYLFSIQDCLGIYCRERNLHVSYFRCKIRALARGYDLSEDRVWQFNVTRLKEKYGIGIEELKEYYRYSITKEDSEMFKCYKCHREASEVKDCMCNGCHEKAKEEILKKENMPVGGSRYTDEELARTKKEDIGTRSVKSKQTGGGVRVVRKSEPLAG